MAQNYAKKYNNGVVERYRKKSQTDAAFSSQFTWDGSKTINVTSVPVPTMNVYDRTAASNRFGTPTEVDTTGQDLTLAVDKGAEQIVDFGNLADTNNAAEAGKHLKRVIDEVIMPEIDVYRLQVLATAAETNSRLVNSGVTDKTNAYDNFLAVNAKLSDSLVPEEGRFAFMTTSYYNFLKSGNFALDSDASMKMRMSGVVGQVDGINIIVVPASRMPKVAVGVKAVDLIIVHKDAVVGPVKLKNFRVLEGQQGYDGNVLQWRYYYDAFVLDANKFGIAAHQNAA